MPYKTGLPDALREWGLKVEVVPGWESRGSASFNPKGALCHWTAGPAGTKGRPSLRIVTEGRPDLPGPLCNVYGARDGTAVVVAAGRANHAGAGNWQGLTGNSSFYGTEMEAAGPGDFTEAQRWAYPRINAAFATLSGFTAATIAGHSEYATPRGRKVDVNAYPMSLMRQQVTDLLANPTRATSMRATSTEDFLMALSDPEQREALEHLRWIAGTLTDKGAVGARTALAAGAVSPAGHLSPGWAKAQDNHAAAVDGRTQELDRDLRASIGVLLSRGTVTAESVADLLLPKLTAAVLAADSTADTAAVEAALRKVFADASKGA